MARHYDSILGRRFDMTHPVWREHMLNKPKKKGGERTVKARISWEIAHDLQKRKLIHLVPSVTTVAEMAEGFAAFGYGKKWGMEMALSALEEVFSQVKDITSAQQCAGMVRAKAQANMNKPRDRGSNLHDTFDLVSRGEWGIDRLNPEQRAFYDAGQELLISKNWLDGEVETERQFANLYYGGTPDFSNKTLKVGVDWKTVDKWRAPRFKELLQFGAYGKQEGWTAGLIAYYHQTEHRFQVLEISSIDMEHWYNGFGKCLGVYNYVNELPVLEPVPWTK
jgi:hypothetical protein